MSDHHLSEIFPVTRVKKLRLGLIAVGLIALAGVSTLFGMMMALAADLPALENRAEYRNAKNSLLVDVHGQQLALLTSNTGRIIVESREIAPTIKHALIAIEDRRYYEHDGVDLRGTARALWQDLRAGGAVQGGSTITQQFVKNATESSDERTVFNKLREAALSFHLSRKWSKEKILTEYLNSIYFGNGAYGIESAARTYFGNDINHTGCGRDGRRCASELKPHEAALIAAVVSNPTLFDPVTNPSNAQVRRNLVLLRMFEQGYISQVDYDRGRLEPLPAPSTVRPPQLRAVTPGSGYFASWVRQQAAERYGPRRAFEGGLRIKTTIDLGLQKRAEDAVGTWLSGRGPSAAMAVIENGTGEVRAMVGGPNYEDRPFNLATQGQRQPGSAFKPFVLAAALRAGIGPGSVWPSRKREFVVPKSGGNEVFVVNNYEGNYSGSQSLAGATTFSDNAVYAAVGIKVGTKNVAAMARRMGIRTPVSENYAITLGGLRQGVTVLDMAHAYETFATGGKIVSGSLGTRERGPVGIRSVQNRRSRDYVARNKRRMTRVLAANNAAISKSILATVVSSGTGKRAAITGVPAWGKTGTTENYGDAWFVGSTDRYTVAVWVGYADKVQSMSTEWQGDPVAGGTYPASIWREFITSAMAYDTKRKAASCKTDTQRATERCKQLGLGPGEAGPGLTDRLSEGTSTATADDPVARSAVPTTGTDAENRGGDPSQGDQNPAGAGDVPEAKPAPPSRTPTPSPTPVPAPAAPPAANPSPAPGADTPAGGATPDPG